MSEEQSRSEAAGAAGLSLLVPGLAQLLQRRWVAAFIHIGAVATYLVTVLQAGWGRAGWLAIAWNLWSGLEAYIYERRHTLRPQPNEELKPAATQSSLVE